MGEMQDMIDSQAKKIDWKKAGQLHSDGMNIRQLAAYFHCSQMTIAENLPNGARVTDMVRYSQDFLVLYDPAVLAEGILNE